MFRGVTDEYGQPLNLTYVSSHAQLSQLCTLREGLFAGEYRVIAISHAMTPYQRRHALARGMRGRCIAWVVSSNRSRSCQYIVDITGYVPRRGLLEVAWNAHRDSPVVVMIHARGRQRRQHMRVWDMMVRTGVAVDTWRTTAYEIYFSYPSYENDTDRRAVTAVVSGHKMYRFVIGEPAVAYSGTVQMIGNTPARKNTVIRAYFRETRDDTTRIREGRA